jgi:hypothetical protein
LLVVSSASAQAIIGAWTYGNTASPGSTGTGVFVFLPNGVYFHAESENTADAANGQNGMERGTYTWVSNTFTPTANFVDTNDGWGMANFGSVGGSLDVQVSGDVLSVYEDAVLVQTMTRVTAIPEPSTYAGVLAAVALAAAVCHRRKQRNLALRN